jgi:hypothetical protein
MISSPFSSIISSHLPMGGGIPSFSIPASLVAKASAAASSAAASSSSGVKGTSGSPSSPASPASSSYLRRDSNLYFS